jgi:hypothetical protein
MTRFALGVIGVLTGAVVATASLGADTRATSATATVTVAAVAKLSLSSTTLSFPDANPDLIPAIPSTGGPITITAKVRATPGSPVTLSVQSSDDLRYGTATIPAPAVRWTATGAGFRDGTMNTAVAQTVATWVGSGARAGTQAYTLTNSWNYATGSYSTTFVYTLSAP